MQSQLASVPAAPERAAAVRGSRAAARQTAGPRDCNSGNTAQAHRRLGEQTVFREIDAATDADAHAMEQFHQKHQQRAGRHRGPACARQAGRERRNEPPAALREVALAVRILDDFVDQRHAHGKRQREQPLREQGQQEHHECQIHKCKSVECHQTDALQVARSSTVPKEACQEIQARPKQVDRTRCQGSGASENTERSGGISSRHSARPSDSVTAA